MVITYYGASCFKIQSGDMVLLFDPPSKKSGFKSPRFQTDVVFVSHNHSNHNGTENIPGREKGKDAFLIDMPGEYEVGGVAILGIRTFHDSSSGKKYGLNTAYVLNFEGLRICHLGDFGEKEISPEVQEILGEIDILLLPISGAIITSDQAVKIVNQIEPKIIIPMHYFTESFKVDKKCLLLFLKEISQEKVSPIDKFTLKKKDISEKKEEVVILNY